MKLSKKEAQVLMALMALDTETDQADENWSETVCGINELTKAQANLLYSKLYKKFLEVNKQRVAK